MGEEVNPKQDPVWDTAWSWVMHPHEHQGFDAAAEAELACWLAADPAHRQVYDKASRLWLIAGLVPPDNDIGIPDCTEPDGER